MTKDIRHSARTGRFVRNQRAAAQAYIAVASKRGQPVPAAVLKIADGARGNSKAPRPSIGSTTS